MKNQQVTPGDDQRHVRMPLRSPQGQPGMQGGGTSVTQQGRAMVTPVLPESLWHGLGAGGRGVISRDRAKVHHPGHFQEQPAQQRASLGAFCV